MKTLFKFFFSLLFIPLFFLNSAKAQVEEFKAVIDISVNVIQTIEVITIQGMRITKLQPGAKEVIINPINSGDAGFLIAYGSVDSDIRINYAKTKVITQTNGPGVLRFDYSISGNTEENQLASELLVDDARNLRFNNEGAYYIWVGGKINVENALPGNYAGNFTIEIEYI